MPLEATMKRLLLFLPVLLLGLALAQAAAPSLPEQLAPYADAITFGIGLLSAALVHPLTAIFKRLGSTSGPTTVFISGVLSLVISGSFTLWQAAHTHAGTGLIPALLSALTAFIVANGRYLALVQSSIKGAAVAMPEILVTTAHPDIHPVGTPGMEPLHNIDGQVVGAVAPLTPPANALEKL
jgi:hypothetical protein